MSVIKSIQQVQITIGSGSATATATISAVTTANTLVLLNGQTNNSTTASNFENAMAAVTLTNSTTLTATRGATPTTTVTLDVTVIEFASGVNSIQYGSISIPAGGSNTATLGTAVGANAFVHLLGVYTSSTGLQGTASEVGVALTSSTVVTATGPGTGTFQYTVLFVVADLDSTIVSAVQQRAFTWALGTSGTDTITSVTPANSILVNGGGNYGVATAAISTVASTRFLTNATTVSLARGAGGSATTHTDYYTVVSFASAALSANAVQRGSVAISASNTGTATITTVNLSFAAVNHTGFAETSGGNAPQFQDTSAALTSGSTLTVSIGANATSTTNYEVVEFAAGAAGITGTLSVTQADQTITSAGTVRVSGALSATQAAQTLTSAGTVRVSGTLSATQAAQTLTAAGSSGASGALSATQAAQTLTAAGSVRVSGALSATQAAQTISAAGGSINTAALSATQAAQTLSAAASVLVAGALSGLAQESQTLVGDGVVVVAGALTVVQGGQTLSAAGKVLVSGALNITQAPNQPVNPVQAIGSLRLTQASQTLTGRASTPIIGMLFITQQRQGPPPRPTVRRRFLIPTALFKPNPQPIIPGGGDVYMQREMQRLNNALQLLLQQAPQATSIAPTNPTDGMVRLARNPFWPVPGQTADAWVYFDGVDGVWKFYGTNSPTST